MQDRLIASCLVTQRDGGMPRFATRAAAIMVSCLWLAAFGCDDRNTSGSSCCCSSAAPTFLKSKIDDDDSDGNPADEDFPKINDEDDDIADHAWVRDRSGVYHLFFQNEDHGSGSDLEHYTTTDLRSLEYVGVALRKSPGTWDSYALWAPHIIRQGDTYFMFYTGVTGRGATAQQRIGLATSTDLEHWTRYPINNCPGTTGDGCIYECDECWTAWGRGPGSYNQQCRDAFVLWDGIQRHWVLLATTKSTNESGVVTVAYSRNLTNWTGAGFVDATRRLSAGTHGQTTGGQAENAQIMSHDGTHYLLFTDWLDPEDSLDVRNPRTITQYATSSSLTADSTGSSNWTYRGYIPDPGVNAIEVQRIDSNTWIMSQSISNENSGDVPEHRRELRLKCVNWGARFEFGTSNATFPRRFQLGPRNPMAPPIEPFRRGR